MLIKLSKKIGYKNCTRPILINPDNIKEIIRKDYGSIITNTKGKKIYVSNDIEEIIIKMDRAKLKLSLRFLSWLWFKLFNERI